MTQPISMLGFVNISSAKKPSVAVIHLLAIKTLVESSTHAVLVLQNYAGVIEKRVPPFLHRLPTLTHATTSGHNDSVKSLIQAEADVNKTWMH